ADAQIEYSLDLPAGATLFQVSPWLVEARDGSGTAWLRFRVGEAWDAQGNGLPVHAFATGSAIHLTVDGISALPVLVDPSWETTASMSMVRKHPSATLLPSGKVLVAGGDNNLVTGYLASAELFDPRLTTFTSTDSMSVARSGHTATMLP